MLCRVTELWGQIQLPAGLNRQHVTKYPLVLYT